MCDRGGGVAEAPVGSKQGEAHVQDGGAASRCRALLALHAELCHLLQHCRRAGVVLEARHPRQLLLRQQRLERVEASEAAAGRVPRRGLACICGRGCSRGGAAAVGSRCRLSHRLSRRRRGLLGLRKLGHVCRAAMQKRWGRAAHVLLAGHSLTGTGQAHRGNVQAAPPAACAACSGPPAACTGTPSHPGTHSAPRCRP